MYNASSIDARHHHTSGDSLGTRDQMKLDRVLNKEPSEACSVTKKSHASSRDQCDQSKRATGLNGPRSPGSRPKYSFEEKIALWYLRTDLGLEWDTVEARFIELFHRHPRKKGGMQCKFYR